METKQAMMLTEEQLEALAFLQKLDFTNTRIGLLFGSAGTGKTTVIAEYTRLRNRKTVLSAPTHKAVKVLHSKLAEDAGRSADFLTLHSFLGIRKKLNNKTGKYMFEIDPYANIRTNSVVVVDEASMISTDLLSYIQDSVQRYNNRFVLVGDEKQLNPVGEDLSPIFNLDIPNYGLTKILRQAAENDNIWLSNNLQHLLTKEDGKNFHWGTLDEVVELLAQVNGSDEAKFITWTNDTVAKVNNAVRKKIYGSPKQFEIGETILFREQYEPRMSLNTYLNNTEVVVEEIKQLKCPEYGYDILVLNGDIKILKSSEVASYRKALDELRRSCIIRETPWKEYYEMVEEYADVQYNHAITVHKSQGSTYSTGIVNISEMLTNPNLLEKRRMVYTALTRTSGDNILL